MKIKTKYHIFLYNLPQLRTLFSFMCNTDSLSFLHSLPLSLILSTALFSTHSLLSSSPLLCTSGYYCPSGSASSRQLECGGTSVYCPRGSGQPTPGRGRRICGVLLFYCAVCLSCDVSLSSSAVLLSYFPKFNMISVYAASIHFAILISTFI